MYGSFNVTMPVRIYAEKTLFAVYFVFDIPQTMF